MVPVVRPVSGLVDRERFIALPYRLHGADPLWVPPLRMDVRLQMIPRVHPFHAHGEVAFLLARCGRRVVGRIAAIHNRRHDEIHADGVGFFGFFECIRDVEVARALLEGAASWLRGKGLAVLRGPTSFSMNEEAGLLVSGFETPPVMMMPHNPPHYEELMVGSGLVKAKDLLVYETAATDVPDRLARGVAILERRHGVTTRTLDMSRFDREVEVVKALYNRCWERNWGFVPFTDAEMDHLARAYRRLVVPELVVFAEHEGRPIGFALTMPDINVPLRRNRSGWLLPGLLRILAGRRRLGRLRVILLGALPEWRGKGVDAALYQRTWMEARRLGATWAEAGWILEDNAPMNNALLHMGFRVYKTYRIYERPL